MRRLLAALLLALAVSIPAGGVSAKGVSPALLAAAGWDCILPPPEFSPNVHCAKPGSLAGILSAEATMVVWLTFRTADLADDRADARRARCPAGTTAPSRKQTADS